MVITLVKQRTKNNIPVLYIYWSLYMLNEVTWTFFARTKWKDPT